MAKTELTERQVEVKDALESGLSMRAAARKIGIDEAGVRRHRKLIAQKTGVDPYQLASAMLITGESELTDMRTGESVLKWEKRSVDRDELKLQMEYVVEGFKDDVPPAKIITQEHIDLAWNKKLLNLYVLADVHIGMLSWGEETGADYDLRISEDLIVKAAAHLVENSPPAEVGFFAQMGDFLHYDGHEAETPLHGHTLDGDGRYQKMIRAGIRISNAVIQLLLERHKKVVVLMAEGNHDLVSSAWLREMTDFHYRDNKRCEVITSPYPYYAYQHGDVMLGFHHGHLKRGVKIGDVIIPKYRKMYGDTKYLITHEGHLHSDKVECTNTHRAERHETLASPDAYAARGGWISDRSMKCITYHKKYGDVGRLPVKPEMFA